MLCHLAAFSGFVGIPLGHLVGPLVTWAIQRNSSEFVDRHGKESLNFQLSVTLYMLVVVAALLYRMFGVDFEGAEPRDLFQAVLVPGIAAGVIVLGSIALTIVGAVKAHAGEDWEYPFTIRLLR